MQTSCAGWPSRAVHLAVFRDALCLNCRLASDGRRCGAAAAAAAAAKRQTLCALSSSCIPCDCRPGCISCASRQSSAGFGERSPFSPHKAATAGAAPAHDHGRPAAARRDAESDAAGAAGGGRSRPVAGSGRGRLLAFRRCVAGFQGGISIRQRARAASGEQRQRRLRRRRRQQAAPSRSPH